MENLREVAVCCSDGCEGRENLVWTESVSGVCRTSRWPCWRTQSQVRRGSRAGRVPLFHMLGPWWVHTQHMWSKSLVLSVCIMVQESSQILSSKVFLFFPSNLLHHKSQICSHMGVEVYCWGVKIKTSSGKIKNNSVLLEFGSWAWRGKTRIHLNWLHFFFLNGSFSKRRGGKRNWRGERL